MKALLLDRDGVINKDLPNSVRSIRDFELLPGVAESIRFFNQAKVPIAVVTNQAVVGRDELSLKELEAIHNHMQALLKQQGAFIDLLLWCTSADPQHPDRKPNPGMLLKALKSFNVPPQEAWMVGDALRDLEAAAKINCPRALVGTGKGKLTLEQGWDPKIDPVLCVQDLKHFQEQWV